MQKQPEEQEADGNCSAMFRAGTEGAAEGVQKRVKGMKVQAGVTEEVQTAAEEQEHTGAEGQAPSHVVEICAPWRTLTASWTKPLASQ